MGCGRSLLFLKWTLCHPLRRVCGLHQKVTERELGEICDFFKFRYITKNGGRKIEREVKGASDKKTLEISALSDQLKRNLSSMIKIDTAVFPFVIYRF